MVPNKLRDQFREWVNKNDQELVHRCNNKKFKKNSKCQNEQDSKAGKRLKELNDAQILA